MFPDSVKCTSLECQWVVWLASLVSVILPHHICLFRFIITLIFFDVTDVFVKYVIRFYRHCNESKFCLPFWWAKYTGYILSTNENVNRLLSDLPKTS